MSYQVIEEFTHAKTGKEKDNEDKIVLAHDFAAVIDGMTPQDKTLYEGASPAQICTNLLAECIQYFSPDITWSEAVSRLTECINGYYQEHGILEEVMNTPHKRMGANAVIYSHQRKELWFIGDCQSIVDGMHVTNEKLVDKLMTDMRATIIREYLLTMDLQDLINQDQSTLDIQPFLQRQYLFQNNPVASPLSYTVIDGFQVIMNQIKVVDVSHASEIVLASDGYPILQESLAESEALLSHMLRNDPLCYKIVPNTKGLEKGKDSFDDRAYLRIKI